LAASTLLSLTFCTHAGVQGWLARPHNTSCSHCSLTAVQNQPMACGTSRIKRFEARIIFMNGKLRQV